jgi:ParB family chromosome partitioning protein
VAKAQIIEAVTEGVNAEAAATLDGLKRAAMAERAEALLKGTGWLPSMLRG